MPLSSWQVPKAVYSLSRNALRSSVSNPLHCLRQVRNFYDMAMPYSGPPSYTTLARRFSSEPNPQRFFAQKKAEEAIRRGEFIDIHDIDVNHGILESEISEIVGIPYLKEGTKADTENTPEKVSGFLYGSKFRLVFPCLLSIEEKAHWVFFIVDSGAPLTYISTQVAQEFGLGEDEGPWASKVAGYPYPVHLAPSTSHFTGINILGHDFCVMNRLHPWVNNDRTVTYYFGKRWGVSKL
ncbi:MAG: hypothetical protein M1840_001865 [Geoglossum simile]|nr:MAG: hypothetical protein M1840_001865 [Geoglossum simile]